MYSYIIGKIISVNKRSVTLENNYFGYVVWVSDPNKFQPNKVVKLFLYKHISNNNKGNTIEELYGFEKYEEKDFFLTLINISGIGVKTAITICQNDIRLMKQLIAQKNVEGLRQLSCITSKYAKLMCDNIDENLFHTSDNSLINATDLIGALKSLGYKQFDIDQAVRKILQDTQFNSHSDLSDLISAAIKLITVPENNGEFIKA